RLQVKVDVRAVDRQPPMVGIDPTPGFAVLPSLSFAGEPGRPVKAEVENSDYAPTQPRLGHTALDVEPGRAPGWTPRIAHVDRREVPAHRVGIADGLASHAEGGQVEGFGLPLSHPINSFSASRGTARRPWHARR